MLTPENIRCVALRLALLLIAGATASCGPGETPSPVGRYRLERQHFREVVLGPAQTGGILRRRNLLFDMARNGLSLEIHGDGTWRMQGVADGEEEVGTEGTWSLNGSELVLDYTLEMNIENVKRVRGTFVDGIIEFKPDPEMRGPLRFVPPGYRRP